MENIAGLFSQMAWLRKQKSTTWFESSMSSPPIQTRWLARREWYRHGPDAQVRDIKEQTSCIALCRYSARSF